ncbi:site-specific integrase [Magnetospirillum sp. UT-4]|uniref:tyrosine-type recombinase/integrase n=1 Tax=Magnetospirillum sp. UT-4 TaxID=2681467 RepID=UPI00138421FC|nr:site-specific integrase [Magnetospirillum sp. UT-4]CAA7613499.1 putative integrase [Magnetospirillum sp. UT-4]
MATVSKRRWTTPSGEKREAWTLTYMDRDGKRYRKQFSRKAEADAERVRVEGELAGGIHVPDRDSRTVEDAAKAFLADFQQLVAAGKRERSTFDAYERQVELHLRPYAIAKRKLSRLTGPDCTQYGRALEAELSDAMSTRVYAMFRQIIKFAHGGGWIAADPARSVTIRTRGERHQDDNEGAVAIPPKAQLRALYQAAREFDDTGYAEAMVSVLVFAGLRISELLALPRRALFLADGSLRVLQRADRYRAIGAVKTKRARRTVPLPPIAVQALRKWLPNATASNLGLVFPTVGGSRGEGGGVQSYHNLYHRFWVPLLTRAGLVTWDETEGDDEGKAHPFFAFHTLRHVAVSLWIEQGATPKQVTTWAGHSSIQFTMDTYGHLWSDKTSDQAIARAAQTSLIG